MYVCVYTVIYTLTQWTYTASAPCHADSKHSSSRSGLRPVPTVHVEGAVTGGVRGVPSAVAKKVNKVCMYMCMYVCMYVYVMLRYVNGDH